MKKIINSILLLTICLSLLCSCGKISAYDRLSEEGKAVVDIVLNHYQLWSQHGNDSCDSVRFFYSGNNIIFRTTYTINSPKYAGELAGVKSYTFNYNDKIHHYYKVNKDTERLILLKTTTYVSSGSYSFSTSNNTTEQRETLASAYSSSSSFENEPISLNF